MTDPSATVEQPHEILPPVDRGMSIGKATVIAVISGIIVLGSTIAVIKGTLSAGLLLIFADLLQLLPLAFPYAPIDILLSAMLATAERRGKARQEKGEPQQ